jgi:fimbrial isopeptide formation D2 family protein
MMLSKFSRSFVACLLLYFCTAFNTSVGVAQTLGGTVISNQASASYSVLGLDSSGSSNEVQSTVPSLCTLALTPDGSSTTPARSVEAIPGATIYFPYSLNYTGNITTTIFLQPVTKVSSTSLPKTVAVILDSNSNGLFDVGETEITSLDVALASSTALLLAVTLEETYPSAGTMDVNIRANCEGEPIFDEDNISRVNVLENGVTAFSKTSVPVTGSQVNPGDTITYTVSFSVNEMTLTNALIEDVLADALSTPTALRLTINNAPRTGAVYNAATRTVTATLGTLNPADVVALTISATVLPDTPGAVTIDNQATLAFMGGSLTTNTVTHTTPATCAVTIQPNGTLPELAHAQNALPGDTVVYPYTLTNSGNVTNDFMLETTLANNDFMPTLSVVLDGNQNGTLDADELIITQLDDLPRNETAYLLLVIAVPSHKETQGNAFVNIIGRCAAMPTIADDNNISRVTVPNGGITGLLKTAEPADGKIIYPGAELHYFIEFVANGRDLHNVVITDVLDERLTLPSSFTTGEIRDEQSGLTANVVAIFNETSRKLTWTFVNVPADMKVRLEIITSVNTSTHPQVGDVISNTAMFSSTDTSEISTNTVAHRFDQLGILLSKVATPQQVFVGDTLNYTLTIANPDESINLRELVLTDVLPDELRYKEGTARVRFPGTEEQALEPTIDGQTLTWVLPGLKPTEQIIVTIGTEVLAAALYTDEIINQASLIANDLQGRAAAAAAASAAAIVDKGVFNAPPVLLGMVFEDSNGNSVYNQGTDLPVAGVRMYLSDGSSVISDELGRYTFVELQAGIDVVKVDTTTLPARLLAETKTETNPGLWRVPLETGSITRQDVPLLRPGARLAVNQALNIEMGPLHLQKRVVVTDSATTVMMKVSSTEALHGLVIQDVLPEGATLLSVAAGIMSDRLTFNLGDLSANNPTTLEYSVQAEGVNVSDLLSAPTIRWEVQP